MKIGENMGEEEEKFISDFTKFYEKFFNDTAGQILMLADIQKNYKEMYDKIKDFGTNPQIIEELIAKLNPEQQGMLLSILLQAGNFGRRTARLFESTEEEKITLAKDLKTFSDGLKTKIEKAKKL
jgi:hypothetical protein